MVAEATGAKTWVGGLAGIGKLMTTRGGDARCGNKSWNKPGNRNSQKYPPLANTPMAWNMSARNKLENTPRRLRSWYSLPDATTLIPPNAHYPNSTCWKISWGASPDHGLKRYSIIKRPFPIISRKRLRNPTPALPTPEGILAARISPETTSPTTLPRENQQHV